MAAAAKENPSKKPSTDVKATLTEKSAPKGNNADELLDIIMHGVTSYREECKRLNIVNADDDKLAEAIFHTTLCLKDPAVLLEVKQQASFPKALKEYFYHRVMALKTKRFFQHSIVDQIQTIAKQRGMALPTLPPLEAALLKGDQPHLGPRKSPELGSATKMIVTTILQTVLYTLGHHLIRHNLTKITNTELYDCLNTLAALAKKDKSGLSNQFKENQDNILDPVRQEQFVNAIFADAKLQHGFDQSGMKSLLDFLKKSYTLNPKEGFIDCMFFYCAAFQSNKHVKAAMVDCIKLANKIFNLNLSANFDVFKVIINTYLPGLFYARVDNKYYARDIVLGHFPDFDPRNRTESLQKLQLFLINSKLSLIFSSPCSAGRDAFIQSHLNTNKETWDAMLASVVIQPSEEHAVGIQAPGGPLPAATNNAVAAPLKLY